MRSLVLSIIAAGLLLGQPAAAASHSEEKVAAVATLMQTLKTEQQLGPMINSMLEKFMPLFLQANPGRQADIEPILVEELQTSFAANQQTFLNLIAQAYLENFEIDEIEALNGFMASPVGQKFVGKQPVVARQARQAGMILGQAMAREALPRIVERLRAASLKVPDKP
ncbi:MAG: DUF2059 domain-containing protein [Pseudomonadota bacterium]